MIKIIKQLYFRYKELINYVIVGGLTTVVSLASYYFFTAVFLNPQDPFQLMAANNNGMQRAIFAQGRMWKPIAQIGKNF